MQDPRLTQILTCPNGHPYIVPRREEMEPQMLVCEGNEYRESLQTVAANLQKVVIENLETIDGIKIEKIGKTKIRVNEVLELYVLQALLYHTLNMKYYSYGTDPVGMVSQHLEVLNGKA